MKEPSFDTLLLLAGDPIILAASVEQNLRTWWKRANPNLRKRAIAIARKHRKERRTR